MKDSYFYGSFFPAFICFLFSLLFWVVWSLFGGIIPNYGSLLGVPFNFGVGFPIPYRLVDVVFVFLPFMIIGKTADMCFGAFKKTEFGGGVFFGVRASIILGVTIFLLFFFTFLIVYLHENYYLERVVEHAAIIASCALVSLAILFSFAADFSHGIGFILGVDIFASFAIAFSAGFLISILVAVGFFVFIYVLILFWRIKNKYRIDIRNWMPN